MVSYPYVGISSSGGSVALNEQAQTGTGFELQSIQGLGLPTPDVQFTEGAGNGRGFRGSRVRSRSLDLSVSLNAPGVAGMRAKQNQLARILAVPAVITWHTSPSEAWELAVHLSGGGDFLYGNGSADTNGNTELMFPLTLQTSGSPFWRRIEPVAGSGTTSIAVTNPGSADAFPRWELRGPASGFWVYGPDGTGFEWSGVLQSGESVFVDTETGAVVDGSGANRYNGLSSMPSFFTLPPGESVIEVGRAPLPVGAVRTNHLNNSHFRLGFDEWTVQMSDHYSVEDGTTVRLGDPDVPWVTAGNPVMSQNITGLVPGRQYLVECRAAVDYRGPESWIKAWPRMIEWRSGVMLNMQGSDFADHRMTFTAGPSGEAILSILSGYGEGKTQASLLIDSAYLGEVAAAPAHFDGATPDTATSDFEWVGGTEKKSVQIPISPNDANSLVAVEFNPEMWWVI